jgi:hypothetical protein
VRQDLGSELGECLLQRCGGGRLDIAVVWSLGAFVLVVEVTKPQSTVRSWSRRPLVLNG